MYSLTELDEDNRRAEACERLYDRYQRKWWLRLLYPKRYEWLRRQWDDAINNIMWNISYRRCRNCGMEQ